MSKEIFSDSVELCETKVCFLHIQLIGTKRMTYPQDLQQNRSLETVPICIVWQCFPHDNIVCYHNVMNVRDQTR